ncbi:phage tail tube protein [Marinifilum flexuosum]|uniref:phage tail tube protein n=1 Tax=Marinifilum flexuosum TaxID=1117708 RepID=UPI002494E62B|nr:phage tail tube protein [Marinifilum flexuosum]
MYKEGYKTIDGNDMILMIDDGGTWKEVAMLEKYSISVQPELKETNAKGTGGWKTYKPGGFSWSGSAEGLIVTDKGSETGMTADDILDLALAKQKFKVFFAPVKDVATEGMKIKSGYVYLEDYSEESESNADMKFSFGLKGQGKIEKITLSADDLLKLSSIENA